MAFKYPDMDTFDAEIERLQRSVESMNRELTEDREPPRLSRGFDMKPPRLTLFHEQSVPSEEERAPRGEKPRRKEIEARRFSWKEPVDEYLLQFELTAKRNAWTDSEKATNLLCALDGQARNILSEIEDINCCTYAEARQLLLKRFGPIRLSDVHEQALHELKLTKGQSIRELSSGAQRLVKLAYPEFDKAARTQLAIKALTEAIPIRTQYFISKTRGPPPSTTCALCMNATECYTGKTRSAVRSVKENYGPELTDLLRGVTAAIEKMAASTEAQLNKLSAAMSQLASKQAESHPVALNATAAPFQPKFPRPPPADAPRKPCPRCGVPGHWAKHCPSQLPTDACYKCNQQGHRYRECPMSLNFQGPGPASGTRPAVSQQ